MRSRTIAFVGALAVLVAASAVEAKDHADKRGKKFFKNEAKLDKREAKLERKWDRDWDREGHRRIVTDYYRREALPPGLARRNSLPPGLERQLRERGRLPPGLQKRLTPVP